MIKGKLPDIRIEDFNYDLPEEMIAQYPSRERDGSKLLVYNKGNIYEDKFRSLAEHLPADSLLVFNNTRVIRARIIFRKETGADIEVFCIEPLAPSDYERSFGSKNGVEWKCIIGNLKKWKKGILKTSFRIKDEECILSAQKTGVAGDAWRIRFSWNSSEISFGEVIETVGRIPLPPYVKRTDVNEDYIRYQTVYSRIKGSVAAPTAGLHFTEEVLKNTNNKGIRSVELTLHIGAGTFQPVRTREISGHEMHTEHFIINSNVLKEIATGTRKIIAVGTTSVRTLESLYWLGVKAIHNHIDPDSEFHLGQWEHYDLSEGTSLKDSFAALDKLLKKRGSPYLQGSTKLMILPGYSFHTIYGMITNFHQPGSTLLLLVSAWTGNDWKKIYSFALKSGFRFLSYGDSSLLIT